MTPNLPEPLYVPEEQVVIHSRVPLKLRFHSERFYTPDFFSFRFFEDFTEDLQNNWDADPEHWFNSDAYFLSPPYAALHVGVGEDYLHKLARKNLEVSQTFLDFWWYGLSNNAVYFAVGHDSYGHLWCGPLGTGGVWIHFQAFFWYDWNSHKRCIEIFIESGGDWELIESSYSAGTFPAAGSIYFWGSDYYGIRPLHLDDVLCYGV